VFPQDTVHKEPSPGSKVLVLDAEADIFVQAFKHAFLSPGVACNTSFRALVLQILPVVPSSITNLRY
jgi:hypothetical protein